MSRFIAALPMYDWPERRQEIDAQWVAMRDALRLAGIDAPDGLVRRNGDMPAVPGGIRDATGRAVAPDPATLAPDELDLPTLWRHPDLLLAQTCRGPLETSDLADHVQIVGQPDYSDCEGGQGADYASVIVMRRAEEGSGDTGCNLSQLPGTPKLPLDLLRGKRLAFNAPDSMSGFLALSRDIEAAGESLAVFSGRIKTGSHRASALAVIEGRADVAALDCRSWSLFRRFEARADELIPVGWTAPRKGLPYVTSAFHHPDTVETIARVLARCGAARA